ncbi:hypothetical protein L903_00660 [Agrobacterium sp. JL28]|nr:hypothetical protein L902_16780 [Agrobacterium radiobacter DSM 30147]KVK51875.1 hypothetical protein L903_00660 [Agrobacterium sp. JL28]KVK53529.1 hypothetical protein L904_04240 [Agrobacterium sp. LY4]
MRVRGVGVLDEIAAQTLVGARRSGGSGYRPAHSVLIPVFVTGIQSTRVCAAGESFQPKDLGWLDPCDKHRNEGGENIYESAAR